MNLAVDGIIGDTITTSLAPLPCVLWILAAAPILAHGSFEYLAVPATVYVPAAILAVIDLRRRLPASPRALRSAQ